MKDDDVGCVFAVIAVGAVTWWLWSKYEIKEREPAPALVATPAPAPRPTGVREVSSTDTGSIYRIDASTVAGDKEARRAWVLVDHSKNSEVTARETRELNLVNCETGGVKVLSRVTYDAKGEVLTVEDFEVADAKTAYYPPGSVGAAVPREICGAAYDR